MIYLLKIITTDLHDEFFNYTHFIDKKTETWRYKCLLKITHIAEPLLEVK